MPRPTVIRQDDNGRFYFNFKPYGHSRSERFFRARKSEADDLLSLLKAARKQRQSVDVVRLKVDPDSIVQQRRRGVGSAAPTVPGLALDYLRAIKSSTHPPTWDRLNHQLNPICETLQGVRFDELTVEKAIEAVTVAHPGSSTTRAEAWNVLNKVLTHHATPPPNKTVEFATIPFNPLAAAKQPFKRVRQNRQLVAVDDFEKVVTFCLDRGRPGDLDYLDLVVFLHQTGARAYEVRKVVKDWVVRNSIDIPLGQQKANTPKRVIRYPRTLVPVIERRLASDGDLLFSTRDGEPWRDQSFKRRQRTIGTNLVYSMTCFRHTFATEMARRGASANDIRLAMGHSSIQTAIQHYIRPVEDELNAILSVEVNSARMQGMTRPEIADLEAEIRGQFEQQDPRLSRAVDRAINRP